MSQRKQPMVQMDEHKLSPAPSPADHVRMLVELLRPGGPELMRRWVSALLLAPVAERETIVNEVERSLVELYAKPLVDREEGAEESEAPMVHVVSPPEQRDGYVEQVERSYSKPAKKKRVIAKAKSKTPGAKRA